MVTRSLPLILWHRWPWRVFLLLLSLLASFFGLAAPFFQKEFVDLLTHSQHQSAFSMGLSETGSLQPYILIGLAFLALLLHQAFNQVSNFIGAREALFSQRQIAQRIYQKTMLLKVDTLSLRPSGEIVSLYATDVPGSTMLLEQTLPQGSSTFFPLILAPIALSFILKTSILPTLIIMVLISLLNFGLAFRQSLFFFLYKQLAAERIALVNEWVNQIRGLRILGWIDFFERKIFRKREVETENRIQMVTNGQTMNAISSSMTFGLNVVALASMTLFTDKTPTSGEMLASLWILSVFLTRPFRQMPWFFTFAFDAWTSITRIDKFLAIENVPSLLPEPKGESRFGSSLSASALEVRGLHLQRREEKPILDNLSFSIQPGEFVAIVGEVGAGKSLFFLSLLGETGAFFSKYEINQQSVLDLAPQKLKAHFTYVPQESFIMSATLAQNISFDYSPLTQNSQKFTEALKHSQFEFENERLAQGLQTELGEKGVNLSGGQKLRISFARAINKEAPIILIDDGFSSLDFRTEEALLKSLFFGFWKEKTKILATHRLSVLPFTDRVVFMRQGQIVSQGPYEDLLASNGEFRLFVQSLSSDESGPPHVH